MIQAVVALLLVVGAFFSFMGALGVLRMPDVLIRMHASTKAATLGSGLLLGAVCVHYGDPSVVSRALAAIAFLLLTAPVAAHLIGRAAWRTGEPLWHRTVRHPSAPARSADAADAADAAVGGEGQTGDSGFNRSAEANKTGVLPEWTNRSPSPIVPPADGDDRPDRGGDPQPGGVDEDAQP